MQNKTYLKTVIPASFVSVLLAEALGFLSAVLAGDIRGKFELLAKPPLTPPGWVFGPVWIILYALMGIAAAMVFSAMASGTEKRRALVFYGIQLALNFIWSIVFFGTANYLAGCFVIAALAVFLVLTFIEFRKVSPAASFLLIPYMAWICFAAYLTVGVTMLN
ncbi:tryptophan-rich sensory protein [Brucepastera parasyntrophica]|uniref:TspO/MBR family protein n=1 Tax=Brucepastera parasyntrophica TaxID=2880008 RepID=UPI002109E2FF|nr:TspO/MBR family protein [Brucepastera parasyntrophica]ULQ58536.1 tryptophan-rich sensory protein [Brucepastera parasyntrophica]